MFIKLNTNDGPIVVNVRHITTLEHSEHNKTTTVRTSDGFGFDIKEDFGSVAKLLNFTKLD